MIKPTLIFLLILSFIASHGQDYITNKELGNTWQIFYMNGMGTAFLITHGNANYFVTARHIMPTKNNGDTILVYTQQNDSLKFIIGTVMIHSNKSVDIALIKPDGIMGYQPNAIDLSEPGYYLGSEGFFLGFPFGISSKGDKQNYSLPIPLVKRAVFSGAISENNAHYILFDGNNNPGFSGGPIFLKNSAVDSKWHLAGVISGYRMQENIGTIGTITFPYYENSGIMIASETRYIKEIIDQNKKAVK